MKHATLVSLITFILLNAVPAYVNGSVQILAFPPELQEHLGRQKAVFDERLQMWESVLDAPSDMMKSTIPVYNAGDDFINLVSLPQETTPFWLEVLLEDKHRLYHDRDGVFMLYPNDRRRGMTYALRGGRWLTDSLIKELALRENTSTEDDRAWIIDYWKYALEVHCRKVFQERRSAFERQIIQHDEDILLLFASDEWKSLRDVGVPAIPIIMERIDSGIADKYDYVLLTVWTQIEWVDQGGYVRINWALPKVEEVNIKPQYWIDWWNESKHCYWWLPSHNK